MEMETSIRAEPDLAISKPSLLQDATALDAAASNGMPAPQGGKARKQHNENENDMLLTRNLTEFNRQDVEKL
jgi:hypothetical protein